MAEEQEQALQVAAGEFLIQPVERVGHGVREVLLRQVFLQIVDILPLPLDLAVLRLIQAPDQEVDLAAVFGKKRADLLGKEDAGKLGDLHAALDGIVIGDGDEIHTAIPERFVKGARSGVAVRHVKAAQEPLRGTGAEAGVDVKIDLGSHERGASGARASHSE